MTTDTNQKEFLTIKESAELTGKSAHTIRGLIKKKRVDSKKEIIPGKKLAMVFVSRESLLKLYPKRDDEIVGHNPGYNLGHDLGIKEETGSKHDTNTLLSEQFATLAQQLQNKDDQLKEKDKQIEKLINTNMALNSHVLKLDSGRTSVKSKKKSGVFHMLRSAIFSGRDD